MITLFLTCLLKRLPAPMARSLFLLEAKPFISCFSYFDSISLHTPSTNCGIDRPVNDLKSEGFLDNLSYDNKKKGQLYTEQTEIKLFGLITQEIYLTDLFIVKIYEKTKPFDHVLVCISLFF